MPELILIALVIMWIYAPRWFFKPVRDECEAWMRESALQGVDDRPSEIFFRHLSRDANQLVRHALMLWRLWLGRMIALIALCMGARWMLAARASEMDALLVLLGTLSVSCVSWAILQTLRMDNLQRDVFTWARCIWIRDDKDLPSAVAENLQRLREVEWDTGLDQTDAIRHFLETAWTEKVEALKGRQKALEEWLPGLEIVAGMVLAATWLCTAVLNHAVTI